MQYTVGKHPLIWRKLLWTTWTRILYWGYSIVGSKQAIVWGYGGHMQSDGVWYRITIIGRIWYGMYDLWRFRVWTTWLHCRVGIPSTSPSTRWPVSFCLRGYEGIIFLATNRPFDLDEAMYRRITSVFTFSALDETGGDGEGTLWWTYKKLLKMAIYSGFSH